MSASRFSGAIRDQASSFARRFATATASFTSSTVAEAISPTSFPKAGLTTPSVSPDRESTHSPPISNLPGSSKNFEVVSAYESQFGEISDIAFSQVMSLRSGYSRYGEVMIFSLPRNDFIVCHARILQMLLTLSNA